MPRYVIRYPLSMQLGGLVNTTELWIGVESAMALDRDTWELEHGLRVIKADGMSAELLADLGVTSWSEMPAGPRRALRGGKA